MSVLTHQDIARPTSSNWPAPSDNPVIEAALGGLERLAAALPHALAVPVMVAHAALSAATQR